ncbi:ABC transporter ATP-binding protein [Halobacteriovorax sp. HLS]|uniref:ABC transporter ATP-binding protein n=1 Tax=Halobacteriovorax sp. HLS TaxID=2234000 RepID=UPI000FD885BE|nr:ABC transporter ATP-binding protein [Halobacteriovorax sp. HLS]
MSILTVESINFSYPDNKVINNLSFDLEEGEILCVLGESGCGKSTLFHCISGFEDISSGSISYNGEIISSNNFTKSPETRNISLVFQDYALFPHLNIEQNIRFAIRKSSKKDQDKILNDVLCLVNLEKENKKYPHELSGGQQQRVAIARSIASGSKLILFDEPFSNLDPTLRKSLRLELREILKKAKISAIFITHDQNEAYDIADRIAILDNGQIIQEATPREIYQGPKNLFVANFLGSKNTIPAKYNNDKNTFYCPLFEMQATCKHDSNRSYFFYIPSDAISTELCDKNKYMFKVISSQFRGDHFHLALECNDIQLQLSRSSSDMEGFCDDELCLYFDFDKIRIITN